MSSDFPTFTEIGEENIRAYMKRKGINLNDLENDAEFHARYCENEYERK